MRAPTARPLRILTATLLLSACAPGESPRATLRPLTAMKSDTASRPVVFRRFNGSDAAFSRALQVEASSGAEATVR